MERREGAMEIRGSPGDTTQAAYMYTAHAVVSTKYCGSNSTTAFGVYIHDAALCITKRKFSSSCHQVATRLWTFCSVSSKSSGKERADAQAFSSCPLGVPASRSFCAVTSACRLTKLDRSLHGAWTPPPPVHG